MGRKRTQIVEIGQVFGKLICIEESILEKSGRKRRVTLCKCECGTIVEVGIDELFSENTVSCGCKKIESIKNRCTTHSCSRTRLYSTWRNIKSRCLNKNRSDFHNYGGKGIEIIGDWKDSFENFQDWAIRNGYKEGLAINRIDPDGNYEPQNCEWISVSENSRKAQLDRTLKIQALTLENNELKEIIKVLKKEIEILKLK